MYRDCCNIGVSQVTPEVLYTVLNESNIFVKYIRLKMLATDVPVYKKDVGAFLPAQTHESELFKIFH
jgi:hypothetical protein